MSKVETILKNKRKWLSERDDLIDEEIEDAEDCFEEVSLESFIDLSDTLDVLANYYGARGCVRVADGESVGWDDIDTAVDYFFWSLKLRSESFFKIQFLKSLKAGPNLTNYTGDTACVLAWFIATGQASQATEASQLLTRMAASDAIDPGFWAQRTFEPFMLWLHGMHTGDSAPKELVHNSLSVYQQVIDAWDKTDALTTAITGVCDYHLSHIDRSKQVAIPEFKFAPFDIVPVEVMAIQQIRGKHDLATPEIKHDLMTLADKIPGALSKPVEQDFLTRVRMAYYDFFGAA
ncbi:hypothetical protein [Hahella sp. NBU794]|uniref:hypothetical protein n=1 Tax=Hahella sp. NBU794 TaxID=3422590 RepID=UPI003D6F2CE6